MGKRISLVDSMDRDREAIDPVVEQNFLKYGTASPPAPVGPEVARRPSVRARGGGSRDPTGARGRRRSHRSGSSPSPCASARRSPGP